MADRIEQQLGLDASKAIQSLSELDQRLLSVNKDFAALTATLKDFNSTAPAGTAAIQALSRSAGSLASSLNKLNTAPAVQNIQGQLNQLNQAVAQTAGNVQQGTQRLTVSFGLLSRITFTQAVVRALREVSSAFADSVQAASDLERQLARTSVIDDFGRSISTLRNDVLKLSSEFNKPIAEVAAAQYELLQRGIKSTTDQQKVFDAALKLSKILNIDASEAIKLVAGTLESYSLSADHAAEVAGQLNQAIKAGNITAQELQGKLGPVTSIASELGIGLDEVNSALIVMTNAGTGTSTALTQLRGLINGLLKPSKEMQSLFQETGFSTATIQVTGLAGALKLLRDKTQGNPEQTAKLLTNIRALSGETQLTAGGLDKFIDSLSEQRNVQSQLIDQDFAKVMSNSAEQVSKALNAASNAITGEFGQTIVEIGKAFIDGAGGAEQFAEKVKTAAQVAGEAAKIIASPFVLAVQTGSGIRKLLDDLDGTAARQQALADATKSALEEIQASQKALADQLIKDKEASEAFSKSFIDGSTAAAREYNRNVQSIIAASTGLTAGVKGQLSQIGAAFAEVSNAAAQVATRIQGIEQQSRQAIQSQNEEIGRINTSQQIDAAGDSQQKVGIALRKSNDLLLQGTDALRNAGLDAEKRAEAIQKLNLSKEYAQQAASIARGAKDTDLQAQASNILKRNAEGVKSAYEGSVAALRAAKPALDAQAQSVVGIGSQAEAIIKQIGDKLNIVNSDGLFPKEKIDEAARDVKGLTQQLVDLGAKVSPQLLKSFGFDDKKIAQILSQVKVQAKNVPLQAIADESKLRTQLDGFFAKYLAEVKATVKIDTTQLSKLTNVPIKDPKSLTDAYSAATKKAAGLNEQLQKSSTAQKTIAASAKSFTDTLSTSAQGIPDAIGTGGEFSEFAPKIDLTPVKAQVQQTLDLIKQLSDPQNVNPENLLKLKTLLEGFQQAPPDVQNAIRPFLDGLKSIVASFNEGGSPLERILPAEQVQQKTQELDAIKASLGELSQAGAQPLQISADALQTITSAFANDGVAASQTIASNLSSAAASLSAAIQSLQVAASAPTAVPALFGRPNYFAFGGLARGQDQIPAMINKNESVINARSTQRFFSQIQALNAGRVPVFHSGSDGGGSVGDINITVPGGPNTDLTARALAKAVQREIRRGNVKRF